MIALVTGGASSGKSEYAEQLAESMTARPLYYVATMAATDPESLARINAHRARRAGQGYETLECYTGLSALLLPERGTVLLDCIGNLCANELFAPNGAGEGACDAICTGVQTLAAQCENLILVTNEVGSGGTNYSPETRHYMEVLGTVNQFLAKQSDLVVEVLCGLPKFWKGELQ